MMMMRSEISVGKFGRVVSGTGMTFGQSTKGWEVPYLHLLVEKSADRPLILDLAPSYGNGRAENLFGQWASGASQIGVAAKLRIPGGGRLSARDSFMQSLKRIRRENVDFLSTHWSGTNSEFLADVDFLLEAKESKLAFSIGLGNPSRRDLEVLKAKGLLTCFDFVQSEFSLCDKTVAEDLAWANFDSSLIFGYSALCEGRMAPSRAIVNAINRLAADIGVLNSALVLRWLMQDSRLMPMTLSTNLERHQQNLASEDIVLPETLLASFQALLIEGTAEVPLAHIRVDEKRLRGTGYESIDDARKNGLGLSPSPVELAMEMQKYGTQLKPLKVTRIEGHSDHYVLLQGQLRYWALVLAFGADYCVRVMVVDD